MKGGGRTVRWELCVLVDVAGSMSRLAISMTEVNGR